jgi:nitrate reductase gamma subunit
VRYAKTPTPLKIPITPAPKTAWGVIVKMASEVLFFRRVLLTNLTLWIGAIVFHICFWLVIIRHLRYFFYPVPEWIMSMQTLGIYAGIILPFATVYLLCRRLWSERELYLSMFSDYFTLFLLLIIAGTGLWMKYHARIFLIDVKAFVLGLYSFSFEPPSTHPLFLIHLLAVSTLLIYFPWSKLLHAPGVFFSPTLFQRHNIEKKTHKNPWDYDVEAEPFYTLEDVIAQKAKEKALKEGKH